MRIATLVALSLFVPFAAACAAADEAPAAQAASPAKDLAPQETRFMASDAVGTIADMGKFEDEFWDARFDLTKAAKVDHLVLTKDSAKWTLTGWVFKKAGVRGITSRVIFFGDGRFELTAPIAIERQQIKRFLGSESVDRAIEKSRFDFNGADDQRIFDTLTYTTEAAAEARAQSEPARKWLDEVALVYSKTRSPEEEGRRRLQESGYSDDVYKRLMNPHVEGALQAEMDVRKPTKDEPPSTLMGMFFNYEPSAEEEVVLYGTFDHSGSFDHADQRYGSLITSFNCCGKYAGDLEWAATSERLENEHKEALGMVKDTMRIRFEPGDKSDINMTSTMDLVMLKNDVKLVTFYITSFMGVTGCRIDGKDAAFNQPAIPGTTWHVPTIKVALPRAYMKDEHVEIALDVEGKILKNLDGMTWVVKDEDNWFPNPNPGTGDMPSIYDTQLVVPKGYVAVSNGAETPCEGDVPAGEECTRFVTNTPIDWPMFNISKGLKIERGLAKDGTPIAVYSPPDLSKNAEGMVGIATLAHMTYEDWFGDDPYNRLYLTPHPKGHGRGSASLLLLWNAAWLSSTQWSDMTYVFQPWRMPAFVSHEIAHQWWGGAAGIRSSRDQWFSEGFADYGCNIVLENYDIVNHTNWKQAQLAEWMSFLTKDDGYPNTLSPLALGGRIASEENRRGYEGYYQPYIYSKGAFVMHMLRTIARAKEGDKDKGDALFKQTVHDFMTWCRGKAPSNHDLMVHFAQSYGMKLDWFFKQWVYGLGIPKVEFSYEVAEGPGGTVVHGHIKQKDTSFIFPVAVAFHQKGDKGVPNYYYQWVMKPDETFNWGPIDFKPEKVTLNDDKSLLAIVTNVPWEGTAAGQ